MNNSIIICGVESSGTRLVERLLMQVNFNGVDSYQSEYEAVLPDSPVVWRRSWPHGGKWPNLHVMETRLRQRFMNVYAVVTIRDWWATAHSQVAANHCQNIAQALENMAYTQSKLFSELSDLQLPFVIVTYESLVLQGWTVLQKSLSLIGLNLAEVPFEEVTNQNLKYYE